MIFRPSDPDPVLFSTDPDPDFFLSSAASVEKNFGSSSLFNAQWCGSDLIAFQLKYTISKELKFNKGSVVKPPFSFSSN